MLRVIIVFFFIFITFCSTSSLAQMIPFAFWSQTAASVCPGGWMDAQGFCWVQSANGGDCTTACASLGGYNATRTTNFAGSGGSNANCQTVMDGLGMLGSGAPTTLASAIGCAASGASRRRGTTATTAGATSAGYIRACACTAPGSSCYMINSIVSHGSCVTAYSQAFADNCGGECTTCFANSQQRCCSDGILSGSFNNLACDDICGGGSCL
jgi:hypothetical protein